MGSIKESRLARPDSTKPAIGLAALTGLGCACGTCQARLLFMRSPIPDQAIEMTLLPLEIVSNQSTWIMSKAGGNPMPCLSNLGDDRIRLLSLHHFLLAVRGALPRRARRGQAVY